MGDYKYIPMSVAENIVKRQIREIPTEPTRVNAAIMAANTNLPKKVKAQRRHVTQALCSFFPYGSFVEEKNELRLHPWVLKEDNRFHLMQFRFTRRGLIVECTSINIGLHALARIIFRRQLSTLKEAFDELLPISDELIVIAGQVSPEREQTIIHSEHGAFIIKFYAPGDVGLTTWVDSEKLYDIQTETNSHPVSIIIEFLKGAKNPNYEKAVAEFLSREDDRWVEAFAEYFGWEKEDVTNESVVAELRKRVQA